MNKDAQENLEKIRTGVKKMHKDWKRRGKKLGTYLCNWCKKQIPCRIPDKADTGSKGFWDSATMCIECGHMNFVCEYPSGKTLSTKMPL